MKNLREDIKEKFEWVIADPTSQHTIDTLHQSVKSTAYKASRHVETLYQT